MKDEDARYLYLREEMAHTKREISPTANAAGENLSFLYTIL